MARKVARARRRHAPRKAYSRLAQRLNRRHRVRIRRFRRLGASLRLGVWAERYGGECSGEPAFRHFRRALLERSIGTKSRRQFETYRFIRVENETRIGDSELDAGLAGRRCARRRPPRLPPQGPPLARPPSYALYAEGRPVRRVGNEERRGFLFFSRVLCRASFPQGWIRALSRMSRKCRDH